MSWTTLDVFVLQAQMLYQLMTFIVNFFFYNDPSAKTFIISWFLWWNKVSTIYNLHILEYFLKLLSLLFELLKTSRHFYGIFKWITHCLLFLFKAFYYKTNVKWWRFVTLVKRGFAIRKWRMDVELHYGWLLKSLQVVFFYFFTENIFLMLVSLKNISWILWVGYKG